MGALRVTWPCTLQIARDAICDLILGRCESIHEQGGKEDRACGRGEGGGWPVCLVGVRRGEVLFSFRNGVPS